MLRLHLLIAGDLLPQRIWDVARRQQVLQCRKAVADSLQCPQGSGRGQHARCCRDGNVLQLPCLEGVNLGRGVHQLLLQLRKVVFEIRMLLAQHVKGKAGYCVISGRELTDSRAVISYGRVVCGNVLGLLDGKLNTPAA
eukprot:TRINITY_DN11618_c0_g3_i1.p4 TRINITY_DN11618_c0_g3~~TRINITY_DN11618_c0_g3_i1.p4  ORF type:complete len:139 (-),score=19.37 TRINITY_DN11618_c0_g3_i1:677-1093(-)